MYCIDCTTGLHERQISIYVLGSQKRGNFTLNAYNFDGIVAMNFRLSMIILQSFCYTCREFQALPISRVGMTNMHTTHGCDCFIPTV